MIMKTGSFSQIKTIIYRNSYKSIFSKIRLNDFYAERKKSKYLTSKKSFFPPFLILYPQNFEFIIQFGEARIPTIRGEN